MSDQNVKKVIVNNIEFTATKSTCDEGHPVNVFEFQDRRLVQSYGAPEFESRNTTWNQFDETDARTLASIFGVEI